VYIKKERRIFTALLSPVAFFSAEELFRAVLTSAFGCDLRENSI